jgi:hypothetical protein
LKLFAFNNVRLSIPEGWDLTRFDGNRRRGDFVLDDGDTPRLDVKWGPLGRGDVNELERKVLIKARDRTIDKRHDVDDTLRLYRVDESLGRVAYALAAQRRLDRFVVVRLFEPTARWRQVLQGMIEPLIATGPDEDEPWRFFATGFVLPAGFVLKDCEMRVGCIRMEFRRRGRMLAIWDVSLLDHVESTGDTADYARTLVNETYVKRYGFRADRKEAGDDPAGFRLPGRFRRRWLLKPGEGWTPNRRALLAGVANRDKNRFSVLLLRHRREEETRWLEAVARSIREARSEE